MPTVENPCLRVSASPEAGARRHLVVSYDLIMRAEDLLENQKINARAIIHGRDLHDAPAAAATDPIAVVGDAFVFHAGVTHRELATDVNRIELDVQQDWWRTDNAGAVEPIAEFPDHLQADIELSVDGDVVARATTQILTGSWGALGHD